MHLIDTMDVGNYALSIEETENKYPYRVRIVKDGELINKSLYMETFEEAKQLRLEIRDSILEKDIGYDAYLKKTVQYLENNGFNTKIVGTTTDETIFVSKENITFPINRHFFDDVKGIKMHFPIIKKIVNEFKNEPDVFYSTINGCLKTELKNSKYNTVIYMAICDALREKGVKVIS